MVPAWSLEKLSSLSPERLEILRGNAARAGDTGLRGQIEELQASRRRRPREAASESPVVGFHFICPDDYEVELLADGRFWSGVWHVAEAHCDAARALRGYVALHRRRSSPSHRQGTIVDWRRDLRTKGATPTGISFLLEPFDEQIRWYGDATGERGYRRVDDQPAWVPH